jgi:hypothetical protein
MCGLSGESDGASISRMTFESKSTSSRAATFLLVVAGCGSVQSVPDTCVASGVDVCGDGIDQDCSGGDAACVANDKPDHAIDITRGGTFTADLLLATDDFPSLGCLGDGGSDVFYQITLAAPQDYYLDTFTSGFDTSLRVFPGVACAAADTSKVPTCNDDVDTCGPGESGLLVRLPSGTSCVVVDQNADQSEGVFQLHVGPGRDAGVCGNGSPPVVGRQRSSSRRTSTPGAGGARPMRSSHSPR